MSYWHDQWRTILGYSSVVLVFLPLVALYEYLQEVYGYGYFWVLVSCIFPAIPLAAYVWGRIMRNL